MHFTQIGEEAEKQDKRNKKWESQTQRDIWDLQDGGEEGNPRGTAMCQAAGQPVQSGGQRPSGRKLLRAMERMERMEYLMHLNVLLGIETLIEVFEVKFIRVHRKPRKQK